MSITERQVQRILTDLENEGLIVRRPRFFQFVDPPVDRHDAGFVDPAGMIDQPA